MTNKNLKLAAMSVALTACVAAQSMAAHAVEGPDSVEDNAAPQAEPAPVEGKTAEGEVEGEEEKQEEFVPPVNDEAKKDDQAPAFGPGTKTDDIIIDYKPAEKPEEPGETDETENPDGTYVKGDAIDNNKKNEETGKDGKIGEATKEETPDSSSSTTVVDPDAEVKKGDPVVGKDEDGNTTITTPTETTGTETTTTTGTGKADSSTTITDTKKGEEINLDDELGKDVRPDWKTDKDAKLGGYTVDKVEPAKDGNSKTLTLTKTDDSAPEKEMSAEDIAKLLDVPEDGVEKKTDDEGNTTYILKKEETSTDENGNTIDQAAQVDATKLVSPTEFINAMRAYMEKNLGMPADLSLADARTMVGIYYSMRTVGFSNQATYTLADNVPMDLIAYIKEHSADFQGIEIQSEAVRQYDTATAAHLPDLRRVELRQKRRPLQGQGRLPDERSHRQIRSGERARVLPAQHGRLPHGGDRSWRFGYCRADHRYGSQARRQCYHHD